MCLLLKPQLVKPKVLFGQLLKQPWLILSALYLSFHYQLAFSIYNWKHKSKNSHSPDSSAKLVRSELKKHSDKEIVIIDKKARDEDF